jgi:hypothetical protein
VATNGEAARATSGSPARSDTTSPGSSSATRSAGIEPREVVDEALA